MKDKVDKEQTRIKGKITSIRFRNSDNWAVFTVDNRPCTGTIPEMSDSGDVVTVIGVMAKSKYGQQLKCDTVMPEPIAVDNAEGVIRVLERLPGIGPVKAKKAVDELGWEFALRIANECPSGLGIANYEMAIAAKQKAKYMTSAESFEALIYLLSIGLTNRQVAIIIDKYGADKALDIVKENPYTLINDIDGFGFLTVDKIAMKAGISLGNSSRINACLMYCLLSSEINDGNIYLHGKRLIMVVLDQLEDSAMKANKPLKDLPGYRDVRGCITGMESEGLITIDGDKVFSTKLLNAEREIWEVANG